MGFLSNLVSGVMDNVIENKKQQNMKALKNDPKLKKLEADLAQKMEEFEDHIKSNLDQDSKDKLKKDFGI